MPVETTYPGVYIEELPSASHTVTPAPTSLAVFVAYANPFWEVPAGETRTAPPYDKVIEVQSFGEYEALFGGFFHSPWLPDRLGQAVFQFFENGGSIAYVVALKPTFYASSTGKKGAEIKAATYTTGELALTALKPVARVEGTGSAKTYEGLPMRVTVSNIIKPKEEEADLIIEYGNVVETYRRMSIVGLVKALNEQSKLVTAKPVTTAGGKYTAITQEELVYPSSNKPEKGGTTLFEAEQYADVFAANAPLDKLAIFNLLVLPGLSEPATLAEALHYCETKRAFLIMDAPAKAAADDVAAALVSPAVPTIEEFWLGKAEEEGAKVPEPPRSSNGAIYFPYLLTTDPVTGEASESPPSGLVAGVFAKEDVNRGVWKAPAGLETIIEGTTGVVATGAMTDRQQGQLNKLGINCIRTFPGIGSVVFGARTLVSANPSLEQWKYVPVRRMALFLEQSLYTSLKWAIFEPNSTPLWNALRQEVEAFMLGLFRQGAFQGNSAEEAFSVKCDESTTSQAEINNGIVNIRVGFAPLKPAEFVVVQIEQLAGQTQS